jgi:hypothetical protein
MHTYATQTLGVQVLPFFMLFLRGHMKVKFAATLKRVDQLRAEIAANKDFNGLDGLKAGRST